MRLAVAAGGTGGHIYPALALAAEIKKQSPASEILFLGSEEGLEKDLIPRAGFELRLIKARALLRKFSYQAFSAPFLCALGFFQARKIMQKFSPRFLISFGGYVSLPAALAAKTLNLPILIHEQNVLPGMVNRFLARFAHMVFLSFDKSKDYISLDKSKGYVVGNPVRQEIISADREKARQKLGYTGEDFVVLVMGGSQGARKINEVIIKALPWLAQTSKLKIFHVVGKRDYALVEKMLAGKEYAFYRKVDYLYNIAEVLAAADLVVSRAGATALAEFTVRGLPMILIPYPFSAEGHQQLNARWVEEKGAAVVIQDRVFSAEELCFKIEGVRRNWSAMSRAAGEIGKPKAAQEMASWILNYERT